MLGFLPIGGLLVDDASAAMSTGETIFNKRKNSQKHRVGMRANRDRPEQNKLVRHPLGVLNFALPTFFTLATHHALELCRLSPRFEEMRRVNIKLLQVMLLFWHSAKHCIKE